MLEIIAALNRSPIVKQVTDIDVIDEDVVKYLKCRVELVGGSVLHINESSVLAKNKYSYHWQNTDNQLIVRWDNAPHHHQLSSFPHHRHEGGSIHESPRLTIDEILAEIEKRLKMTGALP